MRTFCHFFFTVGIPLSFMSAMAQSPQRFNYQGVARDNAGNTLANQSIGLRLSMLSESINGTVEYSETHSVATNDLGLFNVSVGSGTLVSGSFSSISWGGNSHFIKVEMDPNGGTTYQHLGTSQLLSVPYALYAKAAGGHTVLKDADEDTKVQVEESADEDIIRFDVEGTERWVMKHTRLETANTGGSIFIGNGAGNSDDLSDNQNVVIGNNSFSFNTTGQHNTTVGNESLNSNTIGSYNTAMGNGSLSSNTTGQYNTASGYMALTSNTTGQFNTALGNGALYSNTTGRDNTASGHHSLSDNTTGNSNTASGYLSLHDNNTGSFNTAVGKYSLRSNTTGHSNTAVGYSAFSIDTAYLNSAALGYDAEPSASNTIRLGNSSVSTIGGYANWTNVSDGRFKTGVEENVVGLDFVLKLRPITYHLDMDAIAAFNKTPDNLRLLTSEKLKAAELQSGFIAQEVEEAARSVGYDFHGVDRPKNDTSHYGLRYAEFVVPLVKAVQEQQLVIEELRKKAERVDELQKQINELKKGLGTE